MAGEHDIAFKGPFMYEGVTRVPLVIVPPRTWIRGDFTRVIAPESVADIARASRCPALCSLLDSTPTILDLAGLPPDESLDGTSLLPWVRGVAYGAPHDAVFAEWHEPAIRMVREAGWKYVSYADASEEPYHLAEDPHETHNLAGDPGAVAAKQRLRMHLAKHVDATGDPCPERTTTQRVRELV
jgi:arylsulfatase A-like enzyme